MQLTNIADMSLFDATKPLLVTSRLVGMNPKSNWHKAYTVFIMTYVLSMIGYAWYSYVTMGSQNRYLNVFVYALQEACRVTSFLIISASSLFDEKRFVVPLEDFATVDENLQSLSGFLDNSGTHRSQIAMVIFVGLMILLLGPVKFSWRILPRLNDEFYGSYAMNWCYTTTIVIIYVVTDCTFLSTVSIIRKRFNTINKIIDRARKRGSYLRVNFLEGSRPTVVGDLRILRKQYHELWGIANRVNEAYGPHLLVGATTSLALITCKLWMSYALSRSMIPHSGDPRTIVESIMWVIFHVMRMMFLVKASESTVAEAKATAIVLQELEMKGDLDLATYGEIRNFLTQLQFEVPKFTASGFFDIDSTLICGILGAACTYLVILIQMATNGLVGTSRNKDTVPSDDQHDHPSMKPR